MAIRNIDKEFKENTKFLDTIDFIPYFKQTFSLAVLMKLVDFDYSDSDLPPVLEGEVFNYYTEDDLKDYLKNRYKNLNLYIAYDYYIDYKEK